MYNIGRKLEEWTEDKADKSNVDYNDIDSINESNRRKCKANKNDNYKKK